MRFSLQTTSDGSLTVFDQEAGQCFKSQHAAKTECEHVFYQPGVLDNPAYGKAAPFRVLELGFGLGTNFLYFRERGFRGEYISIERDLAGLDFYLGHQPHAELRELLENKKVQCDQVEACLIEGDFQFHLPALAREGFRAHAILFDPFSPKANPECWTPGFFALAAALLHPGGRLVTYSVSREAKDSAAAAGLVVEKHKLPDALKKRSAMLATKPIP